MEHEEKVNEDMLEDSKRLEKNLMKERNYLEEQIQLERERIHNTHFDMSKKNMKIEKYKNKNLVLQEHQEKLKQKVQEANRILGYTKESANEDMHCRRVNQEHQYMIHKQSQAQMHQRIMDLELILKNQEVANQKLKADYDRLASQIQNRVSNTIAEIVRTEL